MFLIMYQGVLYRMFLVRGKAGGKNTFCRTKVMGVLLSILLLSGYMVEVDFSNPILWVHFGMIVFCVMQTINYFQGTKVGLLGLRSNRKENELENDNGSKLVMLILIDLLGLIPLYQLGRLLWGI